MFLFLKYLLFLAGIAPSYRPLILKVIMLEIGLIVKDFYHKDTK